jgi:hypothetical protein
VASSEQQRLPVWDFVLHRKDGSHSDSTRSGKQRRWKQSHKVGGAP